MVHEAVQHGSDGRDVAEQFSPVLDGPVGRAPKDDSLKSSERSAQMFDEATKPSKGIGMVVWCGAPCLGIAAGFARSFPLKSVKCFCNKT
jgi:hypothetical protein